MKRSRIDRIVSTFLQTSFFEYWQAEEIESGSYSHNDDRRERFERVYDAASDGADGSTHRENINDMRSAFREYAKWKHDRKGQATRNRYNEPVRVLDAVDAHFDTIEQWHTDHGTIDQQVG